MVQLIQLKHKKHSTCAPSSFIKSTFDDCLSMSISPMNMEHSKESLAEAAAIAIPCWPAPVAATTKFRPIRLASIACAMALLILCAPPWLRSSLFI
ncbi:unnamed protein product [Ilex paraguariensis]|uniref:Uncharacterized protein n=1 Tax=Ilex paraguariensis TaxID=185542 RepID=A0ABC8RPD1_9AQUA